MTPRRSIKMEKMQQENAENDAKKSESAYSNSCSNSQSKRSYSPKSKHSGSDSSGSSGYGGKQSTSAYRNSSMVMHAASNCSGSSGYGGKLSTSDYNQLPEKRNKDNEQKKSKQTPIESQVVTDNNEIESPTELELVSETPEEYINNVAPTPPPVVEVEEEKTELIETSTHTGRATSECASSSSVATHSIAEHTGCSFTCVVSMQDGILMYATTSMTAALGFTKDMWIGRSFIDFVHPRDWNTFTSQIASGVAVSRNSNAAAPPGSDMSTMVCRIRQYKGLTTTAFKIKRKRSEYMPFLLKLFFKNIHDREGLVTYLVIQASPFFSAFKMSNELILNPKPFVIRHSASGTIQYIDPESVPYLGYLPQDVVDKNALQLYHPSDLGYIRQVYETIIREGVMHRSKPYRMLVQNGYYLKLETEWSAFVNPWSRKLEFVTGKHFVLQGPKNPDVFQSFDDENVETIPEKGNIIRVMNEVTDHDLSDSKSSSVTPASYNRLNYNDTLQRYFDNHDYEEYHSIAVNNKQDPADTIRKCVSPEETREEELVDKFYYNANLLAVTNYNHVFSGYQNSWLTESMLRKHNLEMEKELVKNHRENRCTNKGEKEKLSNELRQKKIYHLARCNLVVQQGIENIQPQQQGVKRASIHIEEVSAQKHRCSSERLLQPTQIERAVDSPSTSAAVTNTMGEVSPFCNKDKSDYKERGVQYQTDATSPEPSSSNQQTQVPHQSQMTCMMFGRAVYRSPSMCSAIDPNMPNTQQKSFTKYTEAKHTKRTNESTQNIPNTQSWAIPSNNYEQSKESAIENPNKRKLTPNNSAPSNAKDEESSYSSFYSSFFKTDSGNNEDDDTKNILKRWQQQSQGTDGMTLQNAEPVPPKRNIQPPWLDHVNLTVELIYKYQIAAKDMEEVLKADREKLQTLEQPALVNEQLGQLYMDLETEGLPAKLNIEEGITSSSSSGEELLVVNTAKLRRRKRHCSQLVMIYEEDAPLPPPDDRYCKST